MNFTVETELTAAGVTWTFLYTAGGSLALPSCSGQLTCAAAPTGSGRMDVQLLENATRMYVTTRSAEVKLTSTTESLIVICGPPTSSTGGPVVRGQPVKCSAKTSSGKVFTVKTAKLFGDDVISDGVVGVGGTSVNKGKGWETDVGPAVFSGNLLIIAEFQQGAQVQTLSGTGRLAVNPRPAPFYQPTFGGRPQTDSVGALFDFEVPFLPSHSSLFPFLFGALYPIRVDTSALGPIATIPVTTGPFTNLKGALLAAAASLQLSSPKVIVHPLFTRDTTIEFFADQDGTDDGVRSVNDDGIPFCNNATSTLWVDRLRDFVRAHEGVNGTAGSHYDIYQGQFAAMSRFDQLEKMVVPQGASPDDLKDLVFQGFRRWDKSDAALAPHRVIDDRDGQPSALSAAAGCALDFDIRREFKGRIQ